MTNSEHLQTMKVWKDTLRKLKLISSSQGITMVELIDRLANAELPKATETLYHKLKQEGQQ